MNIPKQYLPVMPYLIVRDAKSFVDFTKAVFNASVQLIVPRDEKNIMHGELRINDAVIMFADATDEIKERAAGMFLYVDDVDDVYANAVENGVITLRAPATEEYGYSAGFEDPFGNQWWIVEPMDNE